MAGITLIPTTGGLGLYGFMDGEELQPGIADLPAEDLQLVQDTLAKALAGDFDRFDVFAGPITDNQGNVVVQMVRGWSRQTWISSRPALDGLECEYWHVLVERKHDRRIA